MKADFAVILAAGRGTRMNSKKPSALMEVCGRSLAAWAVRNAAPCAQNKPVVVQGPGCEIEKTLGDEADYAIQENPEGEVQALRRALERTGSAHGPVLVIYANIPLIETEYLEAIIAAAEQNGAASLVWSDEESEKMRSAGAWCFMDWALDEALENTADTATIAECAEALMNRGMNVRELLIDQMLCVAAVDRTTLCTCEYLMNARLVTELMKNGVTVKDPSGVHVDAGVSVGQDSVLWPNVILTGQTRVGDDCVIKTGCSLNDTTVGDGCELQYVVSNGAKLGRGVKAGPFVNLRPGTVIGDEVKIGDFMEVKNSVIGRGTKLPHLSYVGDADVGERVNVGCGCVFSNYDGFRKHRTTVGNDVFLGCQTNLLAPVSVGDDAYTAAGSTISRDVPAGAMAFARARQENKEGYVARFRAMKTKE